MFSGDNKATAESICRQIGLLDPLGMAGSPLSVVTGLAFDELSPMDQAEAVSQMTVFARKPNLHAFN